MKRLTVLAAVALAALLAALPASAKFRITLRVEPAHVWVKQPARVLIRTGIVLPRAHGLRLDVVGPGPVAGSTGYFEGRLRRTGPRTYAATVRFPRGGRWRLIVPNWGAPGSAYPPPVDHPLTVQPGP